ncbi:MAG TPA: signal peptidase I [Acidimicrobiales bacterium]|nr:signal peptidase I [Acidimicrobiales bacterium]
MSDGRMTDGPVTTPTTTKRSGTRNALEWVVVIVSALLVAFLIKTFLLQAFYIPSPSMTPTLHVDDRVLVNKLSYDLHGVDRGDIVVFKSPQQGPEKDLIKRVVGLPGDVVEGRDGHVVVNGKELEESYLPDGVQTTNFDPVTIGANHYWMMGDNRANSSDSRVFGPIEESRIIGRAFVKVWPIGSFGLL